MKNPTLALHLHQASDGSVILILARYADKPGPPVVKDSCRISLDTAEIQHRMYDVVKAPPNSPPDLKPYSIGLLAALGLVTEFLLRYDNGRGIRIGMTYAVHGLEPDAPRHSTTVEAMDAIVQLYEWATEIDPDVITPKLIRKFPPRVYQY